MTKGLVRDECLHLNSDPSIQNNFHSRPIKKIKWGGLDMWIPHITPPHLNCFEKKIEFFFLKKYFKIFNYIKINIFYKYLNIIIFITYFIEKYYYYYLNFTNPKSTIFEPDFVSCARAGLVGKYREISR